MPPAPRAYQIKKTGVRGQLTPSRLTMPTLAPHQVLVQVCAASLNYRDLLALHNPTDLKEGLIPLSDAAGVISAIGPDVTTWRVGDRVSPSFFPHWDSGPFRASYLQSALGGGQTDGVLCDEIIVSDNALVEIPAYLTLSEAATLPCAAVTAWHALFVRAHLTSGDTVLIQGTGGVAMFALQLATAHGVRAIVVSSSDQKLERAVALGAWKTINYHKEPRWDRAVHRFTDNEGVSCVLELGGPDTFDRSLAAVAGGGTIAQIGVLTGFGPQANLLPLQFKNATICGICVGSRQHFSDLHRFMATHTIRPVIDRTFDFGEAPSAYAYLESAQHFGKVVIDMGNDG